jgi:hypothetical protein
MWRVAIVAVAVGCSFHPRAVDTDARTPDVPQDVPIDGTSRITNGLIALYPFSEGSGTTIHDGSTLAAVDLTIADPAKVTWQPGALTVNAPTTIASPSGVQSRINLDCKATDGLTVEAWVAPTLLSQTGAAGQFARIVTTSINSGGRNFALGQQGTSWAAEVRTTNASVDTQGAPILTGGSVVTTTTQLVVTSDTASRTLYVNGVAVATDSLGGTLDNWLPGYRVSLASEPSLNNPWSGTFALVAIYDRALTPAEVQQNFVLGPEAN